VQQRTRRGETNREPASLPRGSLREVGARGSNAMSVPRGVDRYFIQCKLYRTVQYMEMRKCPKLKASAVPHAARSS
jgi:hypothetical protein